MSILADDGYAGESGYRYHYLSEQQQQQQQQQPQTQEQDASLTAQSMKEAEQAPAEVSRQPNVGANLRQNAYEEPVVAGGDERWGDVMEAVGC